MTEMTRVRHRGKILILRRWARPRNEQVTRIPFAQGGKKNRSVLILDERALVIATGFAKNFPSWHHITICAAGDRSVVPVAAGDRAAVCQPRGRWTLLASAP